MSKRLVGHARLVLILLFLPAASQPARMDSVVARAAARCPTAPAAACLATTFAFLDAHGDGRVVAAELAAAAVEARAWLRRNGQRLALSERTLLTALLLAVSAVGPEAVIAAYDRDRDGALRRAELFADIRPAQRPLGRLLRDPSSVDWDALRRRFGLAADSLQAAVRALPPAADRAEPKPEAQRPLPSPR